MKKKSFYLKKKKLIKAPTDAVCHNSIGLFVFFTERMDKGSGDFTHVHLPRDLYLLLIEAGLNTHLYTSRFTHILGKRKR